MEHPENDDLYKGLKVNKGVTDNRVSLYRKQVCVEKNIPQEVAVEHLLALIDSDKQ